MGWAEEILAAVSLKSKTRCKILGHGNIKFWQAFEQETNKQLLNSVPSHSP